MRVMVKDAWQVAAPCDLDQSFSTIDVDIKIKPSNEVPVCAPVIAYPIKGMRLTNNETFRWNANSNDISEFELIVSSVPYGQTTPEVHFQQSLTSATNSALLSEVFPEDGRELLVTLKAKKTSGSIIQKSVPVLAPDRYCLVEGGTHENYFLKKLATQNGVSNIDFQTGDYPKNGYLHHQQTRLKAHKGNTISFTYKASGESNCAITRLYVDWNNNSVFEESEFVHQIGANNACENLVNKKFNVVIPEDAATGLTRLRVATRDAWANVNLCGTSDYSATVDFDIEIEQNNYCVSKMSSRYEYLTKIKIADFENSSSFSNNGYQDFSNMNIPLQRGSTHLIEAHCSTKGGNWTEELVCWIDLNNNAVFEDTERLVRKKSFVSGGSGIISEAFQIPSTSNLGSYRMRVLLNWNGSYRNPCNTLGWGEVEDYTVTISESVSGANNRSYCEVGGRDTSYEYVESISVNGVDYETGSDNGYGDYTDTVISQTFNNYLNLTLTPGFTKGAYSELWFVWIDFDQNGIFNNTNELVFKPSKSKTSVNTSVFIPPTARAGKTRMRIMIKYYVASKATSCGTFLYGEAEDYTLDLQYQRAIQLQSIQAKEQSIANKVINDQTKNKAQGFSFFPNPVSSNSYGYIKLPTAVGFREIENTIKIYDATGKNVFSTEQLSYVEANHMVRIKFKNAALGLYFIVVEHKKIQQIFKIVIE